jgi:hypothetical protein
VVSKHVVQPWLAPLLTRLLTYALTLACFAAGCGAANHFDGGVYRNGSVAFGVPAVPTDWTRVEVSAATLAFRDGRDEASVLVNARCTHFDDDVPLSALTNHLIMGTTEREILSQETVPFDSREALHTLMRAKLDGVLLEYDVFVMKKDGCIYDLVYVAPPGTFDGGAPAFERFVSGFHTLPRSGGS